MFILIIFVFLSKYSISAGELSAQNKMKLEKVFACLSDITAKAQLLEDEVKSSLETHTESLGILHNDYTPIDMSRALQVGLKECGGAICNDDYHFATLYTTRVYTTLTGKNCLFF